MRAAKRAKRYPESWGPGLASGWYCTLKNRQIEVLQPFLRAVVQVHVRGSGSLPREGFHVDVEPVVLRGDGNPAGVQVLDRMVSSMVAEL